ncbi:hypothetical protein LLE49_11470 [Alicyclobacillus tolerans]|uniref:hypothetical protein n=1 Tax=Alicyclobacillus tolerans TaxID=90970 RepID=UPI001F3CCDBF|nr:hypothetical protein [Alicyclobacillus tolerans]MCF8565336.1 hypothetical protein [Alicyclobacillus tolerans]
MADEVIKQPHPVDWSRRQFLVGTGGLAVVGLGALFGKSVIGQAVQAMAGTPVSTGLVHVYAGDYYYVPNHMKWRVGDNISLLFHNHSPNRFHEMMIGQGFDTAPSEFGPVRQQFHTDFWDGVHVTISEAHAVDNLATNKAIVNCEVNPHPWLITAPGNGNFSPTLMPGGYIRLDFTVPNKPGHWQYACFVQGFVHYRAGMLGNLTILPA